MRRVSVIAALLALLLYAAACVAAPATYAPPQAAYVAAPTDPFDVDPITAGRIVVAATVTAQAAETRQADATATRVREVEQLIDAATLAAVTQAVQQTQAAATPTAAALLFSMTATPAAAATQAQATLRAVTITQAAVMARAESDRVSRDRNFWLATITMFVGALVLLYNIHGILTQIERMLRASAVMRESEAAKVAVIMLASGLSYDTRINRLLDAPPADASEVVEAMHRTVDVGEGDKTHKVDLKTTEAEYLLLQAVRAGYGSSNRVPSAATLGWSGTRRSRAVKSLRGAVETKFGAPPEGGTFVHERWGTVYALLGAIQQGQFIPDPTTPPLSESEAPKESAHVSAG